MKLRLTHFSNPHPPQKPEEPKSWITKSRHELTDEDRKERSDYRNALKHYSENRQRYADFEEREILTNRRDQGL